jgi:hypothetical protein
VVWGCAVAGTPTSVEKLPAHWRQCADQARRAADQETDPTASETLLEIAEAYEKLAALAEGEAHSHAS